MGQTEKLIHSEVTKAYNAHSNYVMYTTAIFVLVVLALLVGWFYMLWTAYNLFNLLFLMMIVVSVTTFYMELVEKHRDEYVNKLCEFYNTTKLQYMAKYGTEDNKKNKR